MSPSGPRGSGFGLGFIDLTRGGMLAILAFVGMGTIGFLDDYQKVTQERNLGLNKRAKFGGQLLIAGVFAWGLEAERHGARHLVHPQVGTGSCRCGSSSSGYCSRSWPPPTP